MFQICFGILNARVCRGLLDPSGQKEIVEVGGEIGRSTREGGRPSSKRLGIRGGRMRRWIAPALGKRHSGPRLVRQKRRSDQMGYGQSAGRRGGEAGREKVRPPQGGGEAGRARQARGRDNFGYEAFVFIMGQRRYTGDHEVGRIATGRGEWCHIYF